MVTESELRAIAKNLSRCPGIRDDLVQEATVVLWRRGGGKCPHRRAKGIMQTYLKSRRGTLARGMHVELVGPRREGVHVEYRGIGSGGEVPQGEPVELVAVEPDVPEGTELPQCLQLVYVEGLKLAEAAAVLGISVSALTKRCRVALRARGLPSRRVHIGQRPR